MSAKLTKLLFRCSNEHFGRKKLLKNSSSVFFQILSETFPNFRQKFYGEIVKTVFYMIGNLFEETYFLQFSFVFVAYSDFGQNLSDIWHKFFCYVVKSEFYVIRRTLWWKERIFETCFFPKFEQNFSWLLE